MATRDVPMSSDNECYVNATCTSAFGYHTCNCSEDCQGDGKKMYEELPGASTPSVAPSSPHMYTAVCPDSAENEIDGLFDDFDDGSG